MGTFGLLEFRPKEQDQSFFIQILLFKLTGLLEPLMEKFKFVVVENT